MKLFSLAYYEVWKKKKKKKKKVYCGLINKFCNSDIHKQEAKIIFSMKNRMFLSLPLLLNYKCHRQKFYKSTKWKFSFVYNVHKATRRHGS